MGHPSNFGFFGCDAIIFFVRVSHCVWCFVCVCAFDDPYFRGTNLSLQPFVHFPKRLLPSQKVQALILLIGFVFCIWLSKTQPAFAFDATTYIQTYTHFTPTDSFFVMNYTFPFFLKKKVELIGNLGSDPVTREISPGQFVTDLKLATSERYGHEII